MADLKQRIAKRVAKEFKDGLQSASVRELRIFYVIVTILDSLLDFFNFYK